MTQTVIHNKADRAVFCIDVYRIWEYVSLYPQHKLGNLCRTHRYVQDNIDFFKITPLFAVIVFLLVNEMNLGLECRAMCRPIEPDQILKINIADDGLLGRLYWSW